MAPFKWHATGEFSYTDYRNTLYRPKGHIAYDTYFTHDRHCVVLYLHTLLPSIKSVLRKARSFMAPFKWHATGELEHRRLPSKFS